MGNTVSNVATAAVETATAEVAQSSSGRQRSSKENIARAAVSASHPIAGAFVIYTDIAEAATAQNDKICKEAREECAAKGGDEWDQEIAAAASSPWIDVEELGHIAAHCNREKEKEQKEKLKKAKD
eukprot:268796_1